MHIANCWEIFLNIHYVTQIAQNAPYMANENHNINVPHNANFTDKNMHLQVKVKVVYTYMRYEIQYYLEPPMAENDRFLFSLFIYRMYGESLGLYFM